MDKRNFVACPESAPGALDLAFRNLIRNVVRDELRIALREELAIPQTSPNRWPPDAPGDLMSVKECATLTGTHEGTIGRWIRTGRVKAVRAGRHHRVRRGDLESFLSCGGDKSGL